MWRIIPAETRDAGMNMALDEACMEAMFEGRVGPTVRFYRWQPSAVSIGTFQSMRDEVAVDICNREGVAMVRRRTGGGAVYHDSQGELTYSVIAPESFFPTDIIESYKLICGWIIDGLKNLGISQADFHPINDILAFGKKISGNAQTRRKGLLLQHGTILYRVDVRKMFRYLTVGQDKIADKLIASVEERVTSIQTLLPEVSLDQVQQVLVEAFMAGVKTLSPNIQPEIGSWTTEELGRARELIAERYIRDEWNFMR